MIVARLPQPWRRNAAGVAAFAALVLAITPSPASAADARLTTRAYVADEVVTISGKIGVQTSIAFAEDEAIENVAVGDSEAWQITPNKRANVLFVKPVTANARTNMTVLTDRRTYYFDLVASASAKTLYMLRFNYPQPATAAPVVASTAAPVVAAQRPAAPQPAPRLQAFPTGLTAAEQQAIEGAAAPEAAASEAPLNFAWRARGSARLLPVRVYDDGQTTTAVWKPGTPIPEVRTLNDRNEEVPAEFQLNGDAIQLAGTPAQIVLRAGPDRASIERVPLAAPIAASSAPAASGSKR